MLYFLYDKLYKLLVMRYFMRKVIDDERYFGTFSQMNIYVLKESDLKSFLGNKTLKQHYADWLNREIYSKDYILNALKNKMQSIDFNNSYYLMKSFGVHNKIIFEQNAFYELSIDNLKLLLNDAKKMSENKPKNYVFKKHVQSLQRLVDRHDNDNLVGKILLISTW